MTASRMPVTLGYFSSVLGNPHGRQIHADVILPTVVAGGKVLFEDRLLKTELGFVNL